VSNRCCLATGLLLEIDAGEHLPVGRRGRCGRRRSLDGPGRWEAEDYPIEEWKRVFDVNINGLFYCNRYVGSLMKALGYGRIVNVASAAGKEGNPTASAYSASKAAVIGFTKSLGKELAKDGVTVNAVAPAVIETPMLGKSTPRTSPICAPRFR
jgi:NAD(P)-dependent dehydrogenase (short-subunit alcohol dehydrogenase family)